MKLNPQILLAMEHNDVLAEFDCVSGDKAFTTDGKAIHMAHVVGLCSYLKYFGIESIGSHGCVRLAEEDAAWLFDWTPLHTAVHVIKGT